MRQQIEADCHAMAARINELHEQRREIEEVIGYGQLYPAAIGLRQRLAALNAEVFPLHHELSLRQTDLMLATRFHRETAA